MDGKSRELGTAQKKVPLSTQCLLNNQQAHFRALEDKLRKLTLEIGLFIMF